MRIIYLFPFLLALSFGVFAATGQEAIQLAGARNGTIMAISLEDSSIQIDQKKFKLAEGFKAFTEDNVLVSKVLLAPGMKIDYWVNSGAETEEVTQIKISSKFDKNAYPR